MSLERLIRLQPRYKLHINLFNYLVKGLGYID